MVKNRVAYCGVYLNAPLRRRDRSSERSIERSNFERLFDRSIERSFEVYLIVAYKDSCA